MDKHPSDKAPFPSRGRRRAKRDSCN